MALTSTARFAPTSQVLSRVLTGEAVLLDLGEGQYYGLDEIGTVIWVALEAGATVGELVRHVVDNYEVAEETARADVDALLTHLLERKLIA